MKKKHREDLIVITDMELLVHRLTDALTASRPTLNGKALPSPADWQTVLTAGSVPGGARIRGVDYSCQDRALWRTMLHLTHLSTLAQQVAQCAGVQREDYLRIALSLLNEWLQADYRNPNWWNNEIGVPLRLSNISLLLWQDMNDEQREKALQIIGRGSFDERPELCERWTGANLIWFASVTLRRALLTQNEPLLTATVARAGREIAYTREGIQSDGSFFQHGRRLYSGGYGRSYLAEMGELVYLLRDTRYQLPTHKLALLTVPLLDGLAHMSQGHAVDYAATGREYTRPGALSLNSFASVLEKLIQVEQMPRREEMRRYLNAIRTGTSPVDGIRYFPRAAMLCAHIGGIYIGFKGTSNGLVEAEICNGEGILGYHLSYGTHTTVMVDGSEYDGIAPLWDYARIPGTAAPVETDEQLRAHPDFTSRSAAADGCGGTQWDGVALCHVHTLHEGTRAHVTCFATEWGVVLVGSELSDAQERPLTVTVEQCLTDGRYQIGEEGRQILHRGVLYESLLPAITIKAEVRHVTGSYHRNSLPAADTPVSGDVLLLTVERAQQTDAYAYRIAPTACREQRIHVLCADETAHAIQLPDGRIVAHFLSEGSLSLPEGELYGRAGEDLLTCV